MHPRPARVPSAPHTHSRPPQFSPTASWSELSAGLGEGSRLMVNVSSAENLVLAHMLRGLSNKEIAAVLGKSEGTVKNQVASILKKTGETCRRHLIVRAFTGRA